MGDGALEFSVPTRSKVSESMPAFFGTGGTEDTSTPFSPGQAS